MPEPSTPVVTPPLIATPDPNFTPTAGLLGPKPLPTASAAEHQAASDTRLYLTAFQSGFVSAVDPISGHALHQIPLEQGDHAGIAISPNGKRLYVVDGLSPENGRLRVFDTTTWQVIHSEPVPDRALLLGDNSITLSPNGRWLLVNHYNYSRREAWRTVFDTEDLRVLSSDAWQLNDCGLSPTPFVGHPDSKRVFMQCHEFMAAIDADTLSPLWRAPSPETLHPATALSPDGKRLYGLYSEVESEVRSDGHSYVTQHDLRLLVWEADSGKPIEEINLGDLSSVPEPTAGRGNAGYLVVSPDSKRLYVAWEDSLWTLETETLQISDELKLSAPVDGMALSIDGSELYILPSTSGNLSERTSGMWTVNTETLEVVRQASDWPNLGLPFFLAAPSPGD